MRIVIANTTFEYIFRFRSELIFALMELGHKVICIANDDCFANRLAAQGCEIHPINVQSRSLRVKTNFRSLLEIDKAVVKASPEVIFSYTPKINFLAAIVGIRRRIPVYATVNGFGHAFSSFGRRFLLQPMILAALATTRKIFVQNKDDFVLVSLALFWKRENIVLVGGSGVNLNDFRFEKLVRRGITKYYFIGRLLEQKGLFEFLQAAQTLSSYREDMQFHFVGAFEKSSVRDRVLRATQKFPYIFWHEKTDNVLPFLYDADCVVLPSKYREGVPRILIEACACGRPIIGSDQVGIREVTVDKSNGFLCKPGSIDDLKAKLLMFSDLSDDEKQKLGFYARLLAERKFDVEIVVRQYLSALAK